MIKFPSNIAYQYHHSATLLLLLMEMFLLLSTHLATQILGLGWMILSWVQFNKSWGEGVAIRMSQYAVLKKN